MSGNFPRRGDLYWMQLDPATGAAMQKTRPCLVVSNDILNERRRTVFVVPLSTTSPKKFPLYVRLPSLGDTSQGVIDQIRVIDKGGIGTRIGSVSAEEMQLIEDALRIVLDME